ncbi:MAG: RIP metalloprotease RseP [Acidobacteria bacterium]|nr:RIP metalloprotease RseP [Acidobacteriota bacterium]
MGVINNIWWMLVLIGIMILIHELGHYWAARWFDVKVEAFSFGFGPRLFGYRRGETDFRVSLIPFGGYVKMTGEQPGDDGTEDPRGFLAKPRWQRMIIAFAGPAMNIVLAVGLLAGLYMNRYPKVVGSDGAPTIGFVEKNSPAEKAGVQELDVIAAIDGKQNPNWEEVTLTVVGAANRELPMVLNRNGQQVLATITPDIDDQTGVGNAGWYDRHEIQVGALSAGMGAEKAGLRGGDVLVALDGIPLRSTAKLHSLLKEGAGKPVQLTYSREGKQTTVTVEPKLTELDPKNKRYLLGVQLTPRITFVSLPLGEALRESVHQNRRSAGVILQLLRGMVERRMSPKSLEGPIGIARLSSEAAREGFATFIGLMAAVSLNLAVFNLLPIPILDGGTILMLLIEMVMRRDLSLQLKENIFKLGFVFLMMIVAFVLYNDISKLLPS